MVHGSEGRTHTKQFIVGGSFLTPKSPKREQTTDRRTVDRLDNVQARGKEVPVVSARVGQARKSA